MEYARVEGETIIERREIASIPPHKAYIWRPVVYEGDGPLSDIVIEAEQVRVVRTVPPITAAQVKAEAQRRIILMTGAPDFNSCIVKQLNALMRVGELNNKLAMGDTLTEAEAVEAVALQAMANAIKAVRASSNTIEALSPIPADYADNARWTA